MTEVISVKFKNRGKVYFFDPHGIAVRTGEKVVVETSRGLELAECVQGSHAVPDETVVQPLRSLARIATKDDLRIEEINRRREKEAFAICKQKIAEHGLDMKLVDVECSFEGNKTMFFFTSDGRVDFRELVKDLASVFRNRIELRQIGVRDEAKMLGGIGICGRPYCCSQFLDDFQPVSTKMAKVQSMSLNPSKISGACGRLMCCLRYEQAAYEELVKAVPKVGAFVETPAGYGTVSSVNILRSSLKVKLDGQGEDVFKNYQADEIAVIPGGRPKPGEPLPSLLKDRPKPVREEEPKEDPWALPQLFADEVYGDKKPERARTPESGEKKKRPRRRSRGHGGKKLADAQAAPKAAQEGAKSKGQPRQKSQPNRKSGARKPGDKPAGENAERSRAKAQPPKPAEGAAPNGEKRADGHRRRHRGGRGRNKSTTPGNAAPSTPAAEQKPKQVHTDPVCTCFLRCLVQISSPPSTPNTCPVTKRARSLASSAIASPTSSAVPMRHRAVLSASSALSSGLRLAIMSVSMQPGATQLTRMPDGPSSFASAFVNATTAPFVAE